MKVSEVEKELKDFGCNEKKVTKLLVKCGILEEEKTLANEIVDYIESQTERNDLSPEIVCNDIYDGEKEYVKIHMPNCNTRWTLEAFEIAKKVIEKFRGTWIQHLDRQKHLYIYVRDLDNQ